MKRLCRFLAIIPFKAASFCLMLFFASGVAGQGIVKCDDGSSFWVIEDGSKTFAVRLEGDVAEGNIPQLINVEDKALHYILLDKSYYLEKDSDNNDEAVLSRFIKGEEEALKLKKMQPVYDIFTLPSGQAFLLWHHNWTGDEVEQQVHATIILDETIFWLNSPKFLTQDLENIEAFLSETIANVKIVENADGLCDK